jgi:MerR family transcriptional regulator, heat shock protein HspR
MNTEGIYVMQVASMLTDMHPQTLRKYEREGFLTPLRKGTIRLYSDEDISRLKMIKRLAGDRGLNLAGIELALNLRAKILEIREDILSSTITVRLSKRLEGAMNEMLEMLEVG